MSYNILVVDDSRTTRAVIARTLNLTEIPIGKLYEAEDGQEALDVLKNNWIDLVLTDINMPVKDGVEMIDKMSEDELLRDVPVIIISTEGGKTRIEVMRAKGVQAYLRKPFVPENTINTGYGCTTFGVNLKNTA